VSPYRDRVSVLCPSCAEHLTRYLVSICYGVTNVSSLAECTSSISSIVDWFVRHNLLLFRDLGPYVMIFMNACVKTIFMVWRSFVRKGFRALWDNIITVANGNAVKEDL
jgi:hypothetical protein